MTDRASKLKRAAALEAEGKSQKEIAAALGISVMTLHRWRRAEVESGLPVSAKSTLPTQTLEQLREENERLRRLVTDLLLENLALKDQGSNDR
jgi:transposase